MSSKVTTILLRESSNQTLQYSTDILSLGEPCFSSDSAILKIGDGTTPWSGLPLVGIPSNITNISGANTITNIVQISQSDYDSLTNKDSNTLYFIV